MRHHTPKTVAVLALAGLALTGCGFGSKPISAADLEETTLEQLSGPDARDKVESVTCDGGLEPEVGATQVCEGVFRSGLTQELNLEVDSVEDNVANYSITPGDSVLSGDVVAEEAVTALTDQGFVVADVTCEDIAFRSDATAACTGTLDEEPDVSFNALFDDFNARTGEFSFLFEAA